MIDDTNPDVVVVEFLNREIAGPFHAPELGEQLNSRIRPELPQDFVLDFGNVRSLGSSDLGEIVASARRVGWVWVCNMREELQLGACLIGLADCADFAASRQSAIYKARKAARHHEADTIDYPG